jgi:hypothetical protein
MRLLLLCYLCFGGLFLFFAFDKNGRSVSDFERVQISDCRSYPKEIYGRQRQIVIEGGGKKYFLSFESELRPEGVGGWDEIIPSLNSSTDVVLWVERSQGRHWVMGIEADGRTIISPSQGVKFHERERRLGLWGAVVFFVVAVFIYLHIKKRDGLDWKLSRKSQLKHPNRHLRGGRRRV